jgi:hypothetical protein
MGKYDHIPELAGAENYIPWETQVQLILTNDDLWCHVNDKVDPSDILGTASHLPVAADPANPTAAESAAIHAWLIADSKAKTIILCKLAPAIHLLIPRTTVVTARESWTILRNHFHRNDVSSQYVIRRRIQSLRMKDTSDASSYVGQHISCRDRLIGMGATYSDEESVFNLLSRLPSTSSWQQFRTQLEQRMHDTFSATVMSSTLNSGAPVSASVQTSSLTFESCTARITAEATRLLNARSITSGPGSEYANAAASTTTLNVNSITGLRKHKNNPQGVFCLTPSCGHGDHDKEHCFRDGGGMAGQAPWQQKKMKEHELTAAAATAPPAEQPSGQMAAFAASFVPSPASESLRYDLSCSLIDTSAQALQHELTTILDSGTTSTLVMDRRMFWSYSSQDPVVVKTANHGSLPTLGRGDCVAWLTLGGTRHRVRFSNCLHAPGAMLNLLSVGWMLSKGWECNFRGDPARCELVYRGRSLGALSMTGRLFYVDLEFIPPSAEQHSFVPGAELSAFVHVPLTFDLWHARMGHIGGESVCRLPQIAHGVSVTSSVAPSRCESCIIGKHPRGSHPPSESPPASCFLELIHSDVCGPLPVLTPHHKRYFIIFLDDHTGVLDLQLLASKDQALEAWRTVRAKWENQSGLRVLTFRSDNGGEFLSAAFIADLAAAGIEHQLSAPYAHQQNGRAERVLRTIEGRMYAMLEHARLPRNLWGEAALTAAYLFNRSESRVLPAGKMPYEMLHHVRPNLSHIRVFGARCFAHIPAELQVKLGPKSREAYFMGYAPGVRAWRCRDKATGVFFNSCNVVFDENFSGRTFPDSDSDDDEDATVAPVVPPLPVAPMVPPLPVAPMVLPLMPAPPVPPVGDRRSTRVRLPTVRGQSYQSTLLADRARLAHQRELRQARVQGVTPPIEGVNAIPDAPDNGIIPDAEEVGFPRAIADLIATESACVTIRSDSRRSPNSSGYDMKVPPATYDEAMQCSDRDLWLSAMQKEINLMSEMGVYELVALPNDRKAIGCRWVLEFKEDQKGGSVYKARLVAQGFSQVPGVDFGKTFAPVARPSSIRILSVYAAAKDWELDSFDAKRAFLWGKLREDVYMRQPPGFERSSPAGDRLVCHLLSSLYGLKQAAYDWYELLRTVLVGLGFIRCDADYAVFIYNRTTSQGVQVTCIIAWHVDDGLAGSNDRKFLNWIKGRIAERFGIADLGPVVKYLGVQFVRSRATHELWMHQQDYIVFLLEEHGLRDCNPVSLPMDPNHPFGRETDIHPHIANLETEYRKLVGELLYLAMYTRPDIALAVMKLAQHNSSPELRHYAAAKRVLRYLAGTLSHHVHYGGPNAEVAVHGFSDADWATSSEDRISITGYVWYFYGGPISHSAKKQSTQALSSVESEYMALTGAIQDGLWIKSFCKCLQIPLTLPLKLFADNTGAIALSTEAANHTRTKHVDLRYHFIRAHIKEGTFLPIWVSTHRNTADIFTKALPRIAFVNHRSGLSLVSD